MVDTILGQHAVYTIRTNQIQKLSQLSDWQIFISAQLIQNGLQELGRTEYQFENAGFTSVYCLAESHIAIHTWPELNTVTFDVYLCNYSKNNDDLVVELSNRIVQFFEGEIISNQIIPR